jgi:hypothetical protein
VLKVQGVREIFLHHHLLLLLLFFFEEEGEEVDERDFQYTLGFWHSRLHNILYDGMLLWRIWGLLFTPLAKEKR